MPRPAPERRGGLPQPKKFQSQDFRKQKLGGRMSLPLDPKSPQFILAYMLTSN